MSSVPKQWPLTAVAAQYSPEVEKQNNQQLNSIVENDQPGWL